MEQKHWKKLWLSLISAGTLGVVTVMACAGGDWDASEGSMFTPEIIANDTYKPFFRDTYFRLYGSNDDDSFRDDLKHINTQEWCTYFAQKVSPEAIDYWLYTASMNQVDSMIFALKGKTANLTEASKKYSLAVADPAQKAIAFLFYTGFARRNETFAAPVVNYWEEKETPKKTTITLAQQISGGQKLLASVKDAFMKERYVFQLERLYYFNGQYDDALNLYAQNEAQIKNSESMKWRALGYKAACLYKQKKYGEANYIYALIYDGFAPFKTSAYYSFHPQNESDWAQCLALAKTTREKEILWQLFGIYNDPTRAMKEILTINPKSELVDLLLVRAVNIEEEGFNVPDYDAHDKTTPITKNIHQPTVQFINEIASKANTAKPELWYMASAYLSYASGNYSLANAHLKEAEKRIHTNDKMASDQVCLIRLYGKIRQIQKLDEASGTALVKDLETIYSSSSNVRTSFATRWAADMIARLYAKQGEYEKAEMVQPGTVQNRFNSSDNVLSMIAYFDNPVKTPLENFYLKHASLHKADYQDLLAIRYAQQNNLPEALRVMNGIEGYQKPLLGNPFNIHIKDCHDCDHEAPQKVAYTSKLFIQKMTEIKQTAETKPAEAAQNYFLLANGFYNMTYYGNARLFYENPVVMESDMTCDLALKYYLLAYDKSTDREFKTKCLFMAAKCEQNTFFEHKPDTYKGDFKAGIYFKKIRDDFSDTKYYQEILRECGYFNTYITGR